LVDLIERVEKLAPETLGDRLDSALERIQKIEADLSAEPPPPPPPPIEDSDEDLSEEEDAEEPEEGESGEQDEGDTESEDDEGDNEDDLPEQVEEEAEGDILDLQSKLDKLNDSSTPYKERELLLKDSEVKNAWFSQKYGS